MIKINIDASFHPDHNLAGLGVVMVVDGRQMVYKKYQSQVYDNHQAEFMALVWALELIIESNLQNNIISIESDSQLVANSIEKEHVTNPNYKDFLDQALKLLNQVKLVFVKWVPEENNKGADQLARQALIDGLKETGKQ